MGTDSDEFPCCAVMSTVEGQLVESSNRESCPREEVKHIESRFGDGERVGMVVKKLEHRWRFGWYQVASHPKAYLYLFTWSKCSPLDILPLASSSHVSALSCVVKKCCVQCVYSLKYSPLYTLVSIKFTT